MFTKACGEGKRGKLRIGLSGGSGQQVPFEIKKQYFAIEFKIAYTCAVTESIKLLRASVSCL